MRNGFCSLCNSGNLYVCDPNPKSFDCPPDSYHPPYPIYDTYSYDSCRNHSQFGYDCQPQVPLNYESKQGYNKNYNSYPYDSSSLPQQYLCCARCGGPHETCHCGQLIFDEPYCKHYGGPHMNHQCQPMNQDSYNSNSLGSDQPQPPQSPVIHQPPQELSIQEMEDLKQHSGSTTTHSDISLPEYEAFYDDHVKEISSGSTTTHYDSSLYDSFIFDLSINPFPPTDKSDFYEFVDELSHIISPPEYDCFCFKNEPNSGDFPVDVVEDIFPTREPKNHDALPTHPPFQLNLDFILSSESLFTYVVWIFLPFLSYSVVPQYLLSFGNEDTIFDPDIFSYQISSFLQDVSHRSGTFIKFKVLNESPMEILFSTCSPMDQ
uniref:Uncharacterized protein n=1 Tax=Tanacetum cinerariifolium TaxID=118510 RepID=A0A6L2KHJ4_TANCI|nr:hypothetical protein [Tanacetum cinerariifolium]